MADEQAREPQEEPKETQETQEEPEEELLEGQEDGEEYEEDEEREGMEIHPADRIMDCIREILNQEKRLASKNAGSVKYELQNNIYPLMKTAFAAMLDFIDATENETEQEEVDEQIRQAVEENVKIAIENCRKLVKIDEEFGEQILGVLSDDAKEKYHSVVDWAKSSIETTQAKH